MSQLDVSSLMVVVEYFNELKALKEFILVNKKCQDVLLSFKVNPEIHQHISTELLRFFPHIQTLSCSFEDYQQCQIISEYDLYRFRIERIPFEKILPFYNKVAILKIGVYNGNSPILPTQFNTKNWTSLKSLEINASSQIETLEYPETLTRLKLAECKNLKSIIGSNQLKMLRLYDCKSISMIPNVFLTRLEIMKCDSFKFIDATPYIDLRHIIISECSSLLELSIPNSVSTLELDGCTSLQRLDLSSNLSKINFYYCNRIRSFKIPTKITSLRLSDFELLSKIESIELCKNIQEVKLVNCNQLINFNIPLTLSTLELKNSLSYYKKLDLSCVNSLLSASFIDCLTLEEINFPMHFSNLFIDHCEALTTLLLPSSMTKVNITKCGLLQTIKTKAKCELIVQQCNILFKLETPNIIKCLYYNCPLLSVDQLNTNKNNRIIKLSSLYF
ncbi:hypothetical protein ENUP19_0009G0022 [Entamoeba nuttalli]|uniref:Leucine-rich repeat containing protein n=2 Tax=Entamoeba nuttalli TaxID=412467 RepID=K2H5Y1_ENTNP|nr:leucine-rich repeat containing protein [Entamoeba nuttalli P19]EKE41852.1 leucine-rich repeat containing protein [Entamoeba nuttalli P19]|eukprot:XP_008855813.1 leucine-rich repeat containing protein [Entamoeba nuttalli P19]